MIPKLTAFARSRVTRSTSAGAMPNTSAAVARCTSSPRRNASRSVGSPEQWAMIRSSTWL